MTDATTETDTMIAIDRTRDWNHLQAITFDVDATLYNYPRMMITRLHRWGWYLPWLYRLTRARQIIREEGGHPDFRKRQAEIISERSGIPFERCHRMVDRVLYNGWNIDFRSVRPYPGAHGFIRTAVENGLKIAVVTDYPPIKKLEYMGFMDLPWAAMVESEALGELKPSPVPFRAALEAMGLEDHPEQVLHIGDTYNYDVAGARNAGMRTAWLRRPWRFSRLPWGEEDREKRDSDIIFTGWSELRRELGPLCGWR